MPKAIDFKSISLVDALDLAILIEDEAKERYEEFAERQYAPGPEGLWREAGPYGAPDEVLVIDAKGRFVMPGIVDAHSHTAIEGGVNECTDVITAETRVADVIDARDVSIYRQLAGGP